MKAINYGDANGRNAEHDDKIDGLTVMRKTNNGNVNSALLNVVHVSTYALALASVRVRNC